MNPILLGPFLHGYLWLIYGLALALAWYLEWWKRNHK
jgi:hypothetical protein